LFPFPTLAAFREISVSDNIALPGFLFKMSALPEKFLECRLFPEEHLFLAERGLIVSRVMAVSKGLSASKKASVI
jgi:hypothetical protein